MADFAIKAENLVRKFGNFTAINDVTLNIPKGSIYGFLGPNGSGKSTIIRMFTGLLTPTSGHVEVLGLNIPQDADKLRLKIGYMTQKFSLYEDLSVEENLIFIGTIFGIDQTDIQKRCHEQMEKFELNSLHKQRVRGMSGGQKQRLSLAAATMHNPELLFLDEPTSAVDPENRRDFWEKLFDLSEAGTTILVTTHYMDEAERCHRLAILESGILRADDTPENLMKQMGVNIVEIKAKGLRQLKAQLVAYKADVRSAAQLGVRLRVLVYQHIADPIAWLKQHFPQLNNAELSLVRPTLEDVFVSVTNDGEGRQ